MQRFSNFVFCSLSALLVSLALCDAVPAALVAQMSFQSVDTAANPDTTPIDHNPPGTSTLAEVVAGAAPGVSILTGPTGLSDPYIAQLQNGIFRTNSGSAGGLRSVGSNGELTDYINPATGLGSGSREG